MDLKENRYVKRVQKSTEIKVFRVKWGRQLLILRTKEMQNPFKEVTNFLKRPKAADFPGHQ